jgi:hypothetical protein
MERLFGGRALLRVLDRPAELTGLAAISPDRDRGRKAKYRVAIMCIGGGMGAGALFEIVHWS